MPLEDDIQEIKKEIIQSHNLTIKTDNLIKNLSAEIRLINKRQEGYEKKYWINSVGAYVTIAVLCFTGVYIGFEAKINAVRREKDSLEEKYEKVRSEIEVLQKKISVRAQHEKAAEKLLRLKRENRKEEAFKVAEGINVTKMSMVLGQLVSRETEELRLKIGQEALSKAKSLFQRGFLKKAEQEFSRAISVRPPGPVLADAYYQRGNLMLKMNKNTQAGRDFLAAYEADPQVSFADDSLYNAAASLETSGDVPRALEAYRKLVSEHPRSKYVTPARRRIWRLTPAKDREKQNQSAPKPTNKPRDAAILNIDDETSSD